MNLFNEEFAAQLLAQLDMEEATLADATLTMAEADERLAMSRIELRAKLASLYLAITHYEVEIIERPLAPLWKRAQNIRRKNRSEA